MLCNYNTVCIQYECSICNKYNMLNKYNTHIKYDIYKLYKIKM